MFGCSTIPNVNARHSVVLSHDIEKPNNNKFLEQTAEYDTVNSVNKMFKASRGPEFYMQHPIVSFNPLEMDPLAEKPYINPPSTVEPYSYEFIGDDKCISSRDLFRKMPGSSNKDSVNHHIVVEFYDKGEDTLGALIKRRGAGSYRIAGYGYTFSSSKLMYNYDGELIRPPTNYRILTKSTSGKELLSNSRIEDDELVSYVVYSVKNYVRKFPLVNPGGIPIPASPNDWFLYSQQLVMFLVRFDSHDVSERSLCSVR